MQCRFQKRARFALLTGQFAVAAALAASGVARATSQVGPEIPLFIGPPATQQVVIITGKTPGDANQSLATPEPSSFVLAGIAGAGCAWYGWRRRRATR